MRNDAPKRYITSLPEGDILDTYRDGEGACSCIAWKTDHAE